MNIGFLCSVIYSWDSVISEVTNFGLDSPEYEPQWRKISRTIMTSPKAPHSLLYNGYHISFPGSKAAGAWH